VKHKIQTICAATGWLAKYKIKGEYCYTPLACWALAKSGEIEGVVFDGKTQEFVSEDESFIEYVHEKLTDHD
jgi:hypothetical protein